METKEVIIGNKTFVVSEFLVADFDRIMDIEDTTKRMADLVKSSANLSDEEYSNLTIRQRSAIIKVMNELNGWTEEPDFQPTQMLEKKE